MTFFDKLAQACQSNNSLLCVGLDPDVAKMPACITDQGSSTNEIIFQFNKAIIDATHDLVCAYKPQIAYFAGKNAEDALQQTIDYIHTHYPSIPVILDAKRGDIGSTASMYALEAFERYQADAVTANPYMGLDSAQPFLDYQDKGIIFLCRTSNPSAADIQDLLVDGQPLYERIAGLIANAWNTHKNCLLVVGATWPEQMQSIRRIVGDDMVFLVPGVGAQGGDVEALVKAGQNTKGQGLMISTSRAVLYAGNGDDFADKARAVALATRDEINLHRAS